MGRRRSPSAPYRRTDGGGELAAGRRAHATGPGMRPAAAQPGSHPLVAASHHPAVRELGVALRGNSSDNSNKAYARFDTSWELETPHCAAER